MCIRDSRITVEDCLEQIPNRFQLVLAATYRARMLSQSHAPKVDCKNKPTVTALREIAAGKIGLEMLKKCRCNIFLQSQEHRARCFFMGAQQCARCALYSGGE